MPRGKRAFDIAFALGLILVSWPLLLGAAVLIRVSSGRPVLYWSARVGKDNACFSMPKFRTMRQDTPAVATHLMSDPTQHLTPLGGLLRSTSIDELPQLLSILRGHMSVVGPRPALFNQDDLIAQRTEAGVHRLTPGLTGFAQVNGRDEIPITRKVEFDTYYLEHQSPLLDLRIMCRTLANVFARKDVSH